MPQIQVAFAATVAALLLQPIAVWIALHGRNDDRTAGAIVLALGASALCSLTAMGLCIALLVRARGALGSSRSAALLTLIAASCLLLTAGAVGVLAFLLASNGAWIYLS